MQGFGIGVDEFLQFNPESGYFYFRNWSLNFTFSYSGSSSTQI